MHKMKIIYGLLLLAILGCKQNEPIEAFNPLQYVNVFIGTALDENHINTANTYPGAVRPWGMASMSPHTIDFRGDAKGSTAYFRGNPYMFGFGHAQMSGTGCNGSGALLLKATSGNLELNVDSTKSAYSEETAYPGYYGVKLDKFNIQAEFTSTERVGISKFTFPKGQANILLDLGLTPDFGKYGKVTINEDYSFQGYKKEGNYCGCGKWREIYFYGELSETPSKAGLFQDWVVADTLSSQIEGNYVGNYFSFDLKENTTIEVRVGISYVSAENAKLNLRKETDSLSFDQIKETSQNIWKTELSKIKVEGGSEDDKMKFYTGLYHSLIHPNVFSDVNGDYRAHETREILNSLEVQYTNFSMWDTYRTLHPLLSLVYPDRQEGMVKSIIDMYKQAGWLARIENMGHNSGVMVGDPASIIINDTYQRGLTNFDQETAYEAMIKSATYTEGQNMNRRAFRQYMKYGFIPQDKPGNDTTFGWFNDLAWGTVSTALEFNLTDWNIAQYARSRGDEKMSQKLEKQSLYYKNNFDLETGFLRARNSDSAWYTPFDPLEHFNTLFERELRGGPGYVEGSAWNYLFFVPHDIEGLKELLGGDKAFVAKLQTCFDSSYYDATNEPNIAYPFLFNYVKGEEWRSQKTVSDLIERYYPADEFGIPGNDDTGTMSAWLVFSMMGIYPDLPGSTDFQIVKPVFDKITIQLDSNFYDGKEFVIEKEGKNGYIDLIKLNDEKQSSYTINHDSIVKGGRLVLSTATN